MNISPVGSVMSKPRKLLLRRHLQPSQQEADEEVNAQRFRDLLKVIQVGDSILEGSFSLRGYVLAESCQACGRQGWGLPLDLWIQGLYLVRLNFVP